MILGEGTFENIIICRCRLQYLKPADPGGSLCPVNPLTPLNLLTLLNRLN